MTHLKGLATLAVVSMVVGCNTAYYAAMEKVGVHKREIMVDRVEDARDEQTEAKEQFQSALERFASIVQVDGGQLRQKYETLNTELQRSEKRAAAVTDRIRSVEDVAEALFREWEQELTQYSNAGLRRSSEQRLRETRRRYDQLIGAMRRAEQKMQPVLVAFRDHVLYLKHNLNAAAIASLRGEVVSIESDVAQLVRDMEASIAEADAFIQSMESAGGA